MSVVSKKRKREPSPDKSLTKREFIFSKGKGGTQEMLPSVTELHYTIYDDKIPERCTKIGQLFPNVNTFKYTEYRFDSEFQASFIENVPSLRQFIYKSDEDYDMAGGNIAAFINANPQLIRLELCAGESLHDLISLIEWNKLQNITELNISDDSFREKRFADLKNLRKLTFTDLHTSFIGLNDFVFERLEELEVKGFKEEPNVKENLIKFIKKNGSNLKKLSINYDVDYKLFEMPRNLPQLEELCLTISYLYFGDDEDLAMDLIVVFILNCKKLSSVVVGYWGDRKCCDDFFDSIEYNIENIDDGKWTVEKRPHLPREDGDYKFAICIEKKNE